MGKEAKIGLAVILTLGAVFCGVLYQRVSKLKTTKTDIAKAEKPVEEKANLFGSPNKLKAVASDDQVEPVAPARRQFDWSTTEAVPTAAQPEMKTVEAAPPRASFMPSNEEPPAANDRYADHYSKAIPELASEPETAAPEPAAVAVETPAQEYTADVAANEPVEETAIEPATPATPPTAMANPFARTAQPVDSQPVADAPVDAPEFHSEESKLTAIAEESATAEPQPSIAIAPPRAVGNPFGQSTPAVDERGSEIRIAQEPVMEDDHAPQFNDVADDDDAGAPARLDANTVTAAAASSAAPSARADLYDRPSSRYEPAVGSGSRLTESSSSPFRAAGSVGTAVRQDQPPITSGKYRVGPNENFWTVSERAYGSGGYFKALHAYNAEQHPVADDLTVGDELTVPMKSELESQFPELCPKPGRRPDTKSFAMQASAKVQATGETYIVQEGDTLFDIARYELGKASRWAELYELNRGAIGDDINFLRAGTELVLPDDYGKADAVTRQPGSPLR